MSQAQEVINYHETTKHHFHRYARSAGYMDWANQPNPFRIYEGAEVFPLPLSGGQLADIAYHRLYSSADILPQPLNISSLGSFLGLCLGLSAWKAAGGSRWSLRINPSSGNLHPTEGYLILPSLGELPSGIYHYNVFHHALEKRIGLPENAWPLLKTHFQGAGFLVVLSSIFWRESWKYGERAYRYCNLDVGHALAALAYAARVHGWRLTAITGAGDDQIAAMLGLDRTPFEALEEEVPDLMAWVAVENCSVDISQTLPDDWTRIFSSLKMDGHPNRLSPSTVDWSIIYRTEAVARKPPTPAMVYHPTDRPVFFAPPSTCQAVDVIRRRRSATAFDPRKNATREAFLSLLERTLARPGAPPFDAALMGPAVDLLLFVHRVADVDPGLYFLIRSGEDLAPFKSIFNSSFLWRPAHPGLPLWQLSQGEVTLEALEVSCHQEIAGHSAFALAMLAPLKQMVADRPYLYRHLHWECGMIGQVLYLEAEAQGMRGTGIGCFFDDAVTELLGVKDEALNSLYHFTIGHALEDQRIQTLPAYHHLVR
ncbi:MAG: SagB family peptide dehydrogenase [Desulfobacteraceae bacterium]|nr:SagB family peptide dehydrogenase [Desulfobacteraceae bacterium]